MARNNLPSITAGEAGLNRYLDEIRKFPMLEPQQEYMLAKRTPSMETATRPTARHQPPAPRRQDRHGLSRLRPADRRSRVRGQCRPDAGGQEI
jgi:hypothetical protein